MSLLWRTATDQEPHGSFWHVTHDPHFLPSVDARPVTRSGWGRSTKPMLHVTKSPHYWSEVAGGDIGDGAYASDRQWAAEVEPTEEHPSVPRESPLSPETVLDPSKVRVKRVIPIEHAVAETTGYLGRNSVPRAYRYPGPDFPEGHPLSKRGEES